MENQRILDLTGEDETIYKVVVNDEEMYSIWPADRENALGWRDEGKKGLKGECILYIQKVRTDTRDTPLDSLRKGKTGSSHLGRLPFKV